jgi:hypothetical protein
VSCVCGPWWMVPESLRRDCAEHPDRTGRPLPQHNVDESRRSFACLDESYRKLIRINGNLAADNRFDGDDDS